MNLITETLLREMLKDSNINYFKLEKDMILTPSAKSYLSDKKIKITKVGVEKEDIFHKKSNLPEPKKYRYKDIEGNTYDKKPEYMTQIYGEKLVNKDHPIIAFRGKLDSVQSKILESQIIFSKLGYISLVNDLEEILKYIKNILRCEVLNLKLEEQLLLGLDIKGIREYSHNPKKYFGINHFEPNYSHGEVVVYLNSLRTMSRELELYGFDAFKVKDSTPDRVDILTGLNRLSSLFYIMMFKFLAEHYKKKEER